MSAVDLRTEGVRSSYGPFTTALRFSLLNQTRNRMAAILLIAFVPLWYLGFAIFDAIRKTLTFDRRLVFAGYRQITLITAKTISISVTATAVAAYAAVVMLVLWRPSPTGWLASLAGYTAIALTYGAFGLLLGVLVKGDLEGFPDHHGRPVRHLPAEPARQPAG